MGFQGLRPDVDNLHRQKSSSARQCDAQVEVQGKQKIATAARHTEHGSWQNCITIGILYNSSLVLLQDKVEVNNYVLEGSKSWTGAAE